MAHIRGDRVLLERRQVGINQEELARRIGLKSSSYISQIERNQADNVGINVVFGIADALGVSPAYLMGFTDDPLAAMDDTAALREAPEPYSVLVEELGELTAAQLRLARRVIALFLSLPANDQELALSVLERIERASQARVVGVE